MGGVGMSALKSDRFVIKPIIATSNGFSYETFLLSGRIDGKRVRKHFKSRDEALGEKNSLEVEAANVGGEFRARHTRLSSEQLAEAEAAFSRLGSRPMTLV